MVWTRADQAARTTYAVTREVLWLRHPVLKMMSQVLRRWQSRLSEVLCNAMAALNGTDACCMQMAQSWLCFRISIFQVSVHNILLMSNLDIMYSILFKKHIIISCGELCSLWLSRLLQSASGQTVYSLLWLLVLFTTPLSRVALIYHPDSLPHCSMHTSCSVAELPLLLCRHLLIMPLPADTGQH